MNQRNPKICFIKEIQMPMPVPPTQILQGENGKYYYIYYLFNEPKKSWGIDNMLPEQNYSRIYSNENLIYDENFLWKKFNIANEFERLIIGSPDPILTHIVAGTIIANIIEDGKVWLFIIGKASSGKTFTVNLFRSLENHKLVYYVGKFTSSAFFSVKNYNESIIMKVSRGGTIICKDFSSFLARGIPNFYAIMNMLREIYDGFYEDKTTLGTYRWIGKIGMIICGTSAIHRKRKYLHEMGDRFLYYSINSVFQPVLCQNDLGDYIMNFCYDKLLNDKGQVIALKDFPNKYFKEIEMIAEMIEICRTNNPLKYRGMRDYVIEPNQHYRVMHQLNSLAVGMSIAAGYNYVTEKIIKILLELVYRGSIERYSRIVNYVFKEKINSIKVIKKNYNLSDKVFELALSDLIEFNLLQIDGEKIIPSDKFKYIYEKY